MIVVDRDTRLTEEIRKEIEEFIITGDSQEAIELSIRTGQEFHGDRYPKYFTGDLKAKVVLVHLNYQSTNNFADGETEENDFHRFEDYLDYHQHFGKYNFSNNAPRKIKSILELKQIQFLQPFGVVDFVSEQTEDSRWINLERFSDRILQLKLIPYTSKKFSLRGLTPELLKPHLERILNIIISYPRDYIIFHGTAFEQILSKYIAAKQKFELIEQKGKSTCKNLRFLLLNLTYGGQTLKAGLIRSFASLRIPLSYYGKQCQHLYDRGTRF